MKARSIGVLLVAVFLISASPSGASASHSFSHIIETLRNALIEVHRTFSLPAAPSDIFRTGDRIMVQSLHGVRSDPLFSSWIVVGGIPAGTRGTVIGTPKRVAGNTYWNVIYDTGVFGWSSEIYLTKDSAPAPISTPTPASAPISAPTPTPSPAPAPSPTLASISPISVSALQSATFTLAGTNFKPGAIIVYSGPSSGIITAVYDSSTQLRVSVPSGLLAGVYSAKVRNPDGKESGSVSVAVSAIIQTPAPAAALRYFGYAMIDCGTNYLDEVAPFTNLAQLCVTSPADNIIARLDRFASQGVKAVINLDSIFFTSTLDRGCTPDPFQDRSCAITTLRADYRARWNTFVETNQLKFQEAKIGAFWVKDEPMWNNLSPSALAQAALIVKGDFPAVPTLAIEGWPSMERFQIPPSIDWIGFDFYAVRNPMTNTQYQYYHTILKERRAPGQKIFVVMDGAWRAGLQGSTGIFPWTGVGGLAQTDMAEVARNYYALAQSDPNIVGIGVFLWPSGIITSDQIGSRDLPSAVRTEHIRIGKSITGKP